MGDLESAASAPRRFQTSLLTVFAGIALFLALVGLYGSMAYSVSRRTREVGIRMALGAQRSDVVLLVVRKAALLLALGLTGGPVAAWFATRVIQSFLFNVGQHDPMTIASVCALLAVCGLIASLISRSTRCVYRPRAGAAHRVVQNEFVSVAYETLPLRAK